jgi:hypothetical protein
LPNPAKAITAFDFASPAATGVVTEASHTVAITVPYGTNVTALAPTIAITGVGVSPASGVPQNFTSPVVYTVSAADTTLQNYTVTVTVLPNPAKAITAFNFATPVATGVVTEATHTISIIVPNGTNVTALAPTIAITGASVSPASGIAQNFTSPVTYTVTAADTTTQAYVVTVTVTTIFRISAGAYGGTIWSSSNGGASWFTAGPTGNWTSLTGSADGTKLLASAGAYSTPSSIYRSTDGGASWNSLSAASLAYTGLSSNDSGTILGASVYNGTQVFYYSIDSGTTWNSTTISGYQWWSSAYCSANGLSWIIMNGGDSSTNVKVLKATFDGASSWNWTLTPYGTTSGADYPNGYSISKDGTKILVTFAAHAHISSDFGATWNSVSYPGTAMSGSSMSGNGSVWAVVSDNILYTSANGGTSWTPATGLPGAPYINNAPSISYNGSNMALISMNAGSGYVYVSIDGGATFQQETGPGASGVANWNKVYIQSQ